jgi:uncharacterized protein (DUF1778 family)
MPRKKATPRVREEIAPYAAESPAADARLSFRVDAESKELIELAAAHCGQTVSSYAISTLVRDARRVVQEHHTTVLSARDWEIFTELLDNPPPPNEALKRAFRSYREMVVPRTEP